MSWTPSWSSTSNNQGPIIQNKTGSAPGQFPNVYRRYHQPSGRFYAPAADSQGVTLPGHTRSFVRLWDADTVEGAYKTPVAPAGWERGEIVRTSQPAFVLTSLGPMYDPTNPAEWLNPAGQ